MQKLCCVHTRQHPLPVWSHKFVHSSTTHISTNSHPFLVGIVSCTFLSLVNPLIQIWRGTQLYTLQGPMNGMLQSRTIPTHLVMGSLLGPMTLMRDLPLALTLINLGITPKGQYKLSVFWMTHHPL